MHSPPVRQHTFNHIVTHNLALASFIVMGCKTLLALSLSVRERPINLVAEFSLQTLPLSITASFALSHSLGRA